MAQSSPGIHVVTTERTYKGKTYDFKGNVLEKVRQVVKDEQILSMFSPPPANWEIQAYRVNWEPPAGATFANHAADLLDAQAFCTSASYDALNRVKVMIYPEVWKASVSLGEARTQTFCSGRI